MRKSVHNFLNPLFMITLVSLLAPACSDTKSNAIDSSETCKSPVANAGVDSTVGIGQPVFLNAANSQWCSDYDDNVSFIWSFVSVPT